MLRCPQCCQRDIHKSQAKNLSERLGWLLLLRRPVRCYECGYRFTALIIRRVKPRIDVRQ
jgi:hypothetical protein